jgi:hypothetical protein
VSNTRDVESRISTSQRWITQATLCFRISSVQRRDRKLKDTLVSTCGLLLSCCMPDKCVIYLRPAALHHLQVHHQKQKQHLQLPGLPALSSCWPASPCC